ncbi:DNA glycosylase AlkZ-like family protein [Rhodococcus triatomae]
MERSSLSAPSPQAGSAEIVSALCGAHAQVLSAAELAVALRIEGATRSDVRTDLWDRRQVVKTYGPRGTVHLLTTADPPYVCRRSSRRAIRVGAPTPTTAARRSEALAPRPCRGSRAEPATAAPVSRG